MPIDPSEDQMETVQPSVESPGSMLRDVRIDRGLEEKDIAETLHITVHYVKAIEADKYEKLPGIVFARGYLKSYAMVVGLNPESVLQSFNAMQSDQQAEQTQEIANRKRKSRNRGMQWALASVACFALLITVAWYLSGAATPDSVQQEVSQSPRSVNQASEPVQALQVEAPQAMPGVEPRTVDPEVDAASTESVPESAPIEQSTAALGSDIESRQTTTASVEPASTQIDSVAPDTANLSTAEAIVAMDTGTDQQRPEELTDVNVLEGDNGERIIAVDAHGEDVLRIHFSGESWVEINDGEDRQIYRDLREGGDILEVSGLAPFNILLGDAPLTSLNFNGADIDVTDNIRIDNSARLTVGL